MSDRKKMIDVWAKNPETDGYDPKQLSFYFGAGARFFVDSSSSSLLETNRYRADRYADDFNSYNYRCDEFKNSHDGLHVLFAGCSVTFGDGLYKEETWPWKVHSRIQESIKTSGYFNLGSPGASIAFSIFKLFKYFNTFGNPDVVFFNMPPVDRFLTLGTNPNSNNQDLEASMKFSKDLDDDSLMFALCMQREIYNILELYCKSNNIKLYSFSWVMRDHPSALNPGTPSMVFGDSDNYFDIYRKYNFEKYALGQNEDFATKPLSEIEIPYLVARDGAHPGTIHQSFYAEAMLDIFDKNLSNGIEEAI